MKNIFRNVFLGGTVVAMLASCDMDLLPTTAIVFDEKEPILLSLTDIEGFQNGVLSSYRSVQYGVFTQSSEVMCDGFNALSDFGNNYGSIHRTDDSYTTSDSYPESMWASHYAAIMNYNVAIEQAEMVKDSTLIPAAQRLQGVALFCRASSYLTLARHFGPSYSEETKEELCVPLVLVYDLNEKPFRATVGEVYDQVISDLDEAEYLLEGKTLMLTGASNEGAVGAMEPTMDAIKALKARYFLDVQEYSDAYKMANAVINSQRYTLADTEANLTAEYTKCDNGASFESIIQLYAAKAEGAVGNPIYTQVDQDKDGRYFRPYYIPSQKLLDTYNASDIRFKAWFSKDKYPIFSNGSRHHDIYTFIKYIDNDNLRSGVLESGAQFAKPLMISEMYLIAAEAYCQDGFESRAKSVLNDLQSARRATLTDGSMESIKKEWFKETVGEGLRMSCLKRWGDGFEGRPYQEAAKSIVLTGDYYDERAIDADSHLFNWPVPSYELKLNENLEQNWGYEAE